ncbi:MAG: hypothetical protein IJP87_02505, partial [Campylobacter sp.]|nr:hypothetical protein [Campylobacter sp.]
MKRDYDKEPLVIKNHNVKIDFVGFVFISLLLVFIFIVAKAEFIMLVICFVVMIFFAKPVKDYAKYKNSYFKFSNDKIEFVNDNEILGSFELNFITQITKIPQMSIAQRQNKSKILSYISNISSIFIFFVLIWLFWGLNLQDFFKLFLILFVIVLFHYFIFAIPQSIYQIFNSKFRFFKFT